ncbi:hypothetical protein SAMN05444414_1494 [Roseovarius marisflavi]|uniref:Uncharacterized protein n=1 Tax=Roseovarius marisflavi TaxID=1054996 RepID=A0A1M7DRZ6_9RHOB|nr:hypothetical protein [Roseovarius marisflavi]SHL82236.1 hypothetical protein SAMN05444414_1494 [Roseovarius marisflavi]
MRLISKLLTTAIFAVSATIAAASEDKHWVILGHFAQDTGFIPRLANMAPKIFDAMVQDGLKKGDQVTFAGTQAAPDEWFADMTLSAAAGRVKPDHLADFLKLRLADFSKFDAPTDGSDLWWSLDQMSGYTDCTARPTNVVIITNGFSASEQTADGKTSGAGVFPGSLEGCHVKMVGLAAYAPPGASLKQRRQLEHMFKLAITAGGAASYGVLN